MRVDAPAPNLTSVHTPRLLFWGRPPAPSHVCLEDGSGRETRVDRGSELDATWAENSGAQIPGTWSGRRVWAPRGHDLLVSQTPHVEGETGEMGGTWVWEWT